MKGVCGKEMGLSPETTESSRGREGVESATFKLRREYLVRDLQGPSTAWSPHRSSTSRVRFSVGLIHQFLKAVKIL